MLLHGSSGLRACCSTSGTRPSVPRLPAVGWPGPRHPRYAKLCQAMPEQEGSSSTSQQHKQQSEQPVIDVEPSSAGASSLTLSNSAAGQSSDWGELALTREREWSDEIGSEANRAAPKGTGFLVAIIVGLSFVTWQVTRMVGRAQSHGHLPWQHNSSSHTVVASQTSPAKPTQPSKSNKSSNAAADTSTVTQTPTPVRISRSSSSSKESAALVAAAAAQPSSTSQTIPDQSPTTPASTPNAASADSLDTQQQPSTSHLDTTSLPPPVPLPLPTSLQTATLPSELPPPGPAPQTPDDTLPNTSPQAAHSPVTTPAQPTSSWTLPSSPEHFPAPSHLDPLPPTAPSLPSRFSPQVKLAPAPVPPITRAVPPSALDHLSKDQSVPAIRERVGVALRAAAAAGEASQRAAAYAAAASSAASRAAEAAERAAAAAAEAQAGLDGAAEAAIAQYEIRVARAATAAKEAEQRAASAAAVATSYEDVGNTQAVIAERAAESIKAPTTQQGPLLLRLQTMIKSAVDGIMSGHGGN